MSIEKFDEKKEMHKFERELMQEEYEIETAFEQSILKFKHGGMTATSFHNMQVRQQQAFLKAGIGTQESANRFVLKCMRIWAMEGME